MKRQLRTNIVNTLTARAFILFTSSLLVTQPAWAQESQPQRQLQPQQQLQESQSQQQQEQIITQTKKTEDGKTSIRVKINMPKDQVIRTKIQGTEQEISREYYNSNFLFNKINGKIFVNAGGGFFYHQTNIQTWTGSTISSLQTAGFAFGASTGYEHASGFGLSFDYLGFYKTWRHQLLVSDGTPKEFTFVNWSHIISLTPTYRIGFGITKYIGMKFGFGLGLMIPNLQVTVNNVKQNFKGSIGWVMLPTVSIEYDNGIFHSDLTGKYIYAFNDITYGNDAGSRTKAGEVGFYAGVGLGLNF